MAKSNSEGKPKWRLVPWGALELGAEALEYGAQKGGYGDFEWKELPLLSREDLFESAQRHLLSVLKGERIDFESGQLHAALLLARALMIAEYERLGLWEEGEAPLPPEPAPAPEPALVSKPVMSSWDHAFTLLEQGHLVRRRCWNKGAFLSRAADQSLRFHHSFGVDTVLFAPRYLDRVALDWDVFYGSPSMLMPGMEFLGTWVWAVCLLDRNLRLRRASWEHGRFITQSDVEGEYLSYSVLTNTKSICTLTEEDRKARDWEVA